jgi:hypothetical protein
MNDAERLDILERRADLPYPNPLTRDDIHFLLRLARKGVVFEQIARDEREPAQDLDETKENKIDKQS